MLDLQAFRQVGNTSGSPTWHPLHCKQELMLLRRESCCTCRLLAEVEKSADLIAKLRDRLIVGKLEIA